jgi:hypothetical protein
VSHATKSSTGPTSGQSMTGDRTSSGTATRPAPASSTPDARLQGSSKRPASSPASNVTPRDKRVRRGQIPSEVITLDSDDDHMPGPVQKGPQSGLADPDTDYIVFLSEPPASMQNTPVKKRGATPRTKSSTSANGQPSTSTPRSPALARSDLRITHPSPAVSSSRNHTPPTTASRREEPNASQHQFSPMSVGPPPSSTSSANVAEISTIPQVPRNIPYKPYSPLATGGLNSRFGHPPETPTKVTARPVAHEQRNDVSLRGPAPRPGPSMLNSEARPKPSATPVDNSSANASPRSPPATPNQGHNRDSATPDKRSAAVSGRYPTDHRGPGDMAGGPTAKHAAKPAMGTALSGPDTTAKTVLSGSPQATVRDPKHKSNAISVRILPQVVTPKSVRPSEPKNSAGTSTTTAQAISKVGRSLASSQTGFIGYSNGSFVRGMAASAASTHSTGSVPSAGRPSEASGTPKPFINRSPSSPIPPTSKPSSGSTVSPSKADGSYIRTSEIGRESGQGLASPRPSQPTSAPKPLPGAGASTVSTAASGGQSRSVKATVPALPNTPSGSNVNISPNMLDRKSLEWSPQAILAKERRNRSKVISKPAISSPLGVARPITRPSQGPQWDSSPHIAHKGTSQDKPFATHEDQSSSPKNSGVRFVVATKDPPEPTAAIDPLIENTTASDPAAPAEDIWASETVLVHSVPSLQSFHDMQVESKIKVSKSRRLDVDAAIMNFMVGPKGDPDRIPYLWVSNIWLRMTLTHPAEVDVQS